ncbi:hypothetical protein BD410DRAFT_165952 [Rickenella mellea]|uniref:Uncharacterized protein n=1 Tax=Rickenella mellea TaxID=50990 RepID=A0A4Y7Q7F0_9AGAM|nr:hypothetical protein BD410DRAFT_165952 [Rickenella mellea]
MVQLKSFEFDIHEPWVSSFGLACAARELSLPFVTHLSISPYAEFLVRHCPAAVRVGMCRTRRRRRINRPDDTLPLLRAVGDRPVEGFTLNDTTWKISLTTEIVNTLPSIVELSMVAERYEGDIDASPIHITEKFSIRA